MAWRLLRAMGLPALLASALCTFVLPLLLFLAATKLWYLYCVSSRDRSCALPLPPGTMGFPFFGETLQMVLQVRALGKGPENFPEDFPPQLWAWAEAGISVLAREATKAKRGARRRPDAPRRPLTRFAGLSLPPHYKTGNPKWFSLSAETTLENSLHWLCLKAGMKKFVSGGPPGCAHLVPETSNRK